MEPSDKGDSFNFDDLNKKMAYHKETIKKITRALQIYKT